MPEHPYVLLAAVVLAMPLLHPLVGMFFGGAVQMAEDIGVTSTENRWRVLVGLLRMDAMLYRGNPGIFLNIIGFLLAFAAFIAAAYHLLLWFLPLVGISLGAAP